MSLDFILRVLGNTGEFGASEEQVETGVSEGTTWDMGKEWIGCRCCEVDETGWQLSWERARGREGGRMDLKVTEDTEGRALTAFPFICSASISQDPLAPPPTAPSFPVWQVLCSAILGGAGRIQSLPCPPGAPSLVARQTWIQMRGKWLATCQAPPASLLITWSRRKQAEQRRDGTTTGYWGFPSGVPVVDKKDRWAGDQGGTGRGQCWKEILGNAGKGIQLTGQRGTDCTDDKQRGLEEVELKETDLVGEGEQSWLEDIGF